MFMGLIGMEMAMAAKHINHTKWRIIAFILFIIAIFCNYSFIVYLAGFLDGSQPLFLVILNILYASIAMILFWHAFKRSKKSDMS